MQIGELIVLDNKSISNRLDLKLSVKIVSVLIRYALVSNPDFIQKAPKDVSFVNPYNSNSVKYWIGSLEQEMN